MSARRVIPYVLGVALVGLVLALLSRDSEVPSELQRSAVGAYEDRPPWEGAEAAISTQPNETSLLERLAVPEAESLHAGRTRAPACLRVLSAYGQPVPDAEVFCSSDGTINLEKEGSGYWGTSDPKGCVFVSSEGAAKFWAARKMPLGISSWTRLLDDTTNDTCLVLHALDCPLIGRVVSGDGSAVAGACVFLLQSSRRVVGLPVAQAGQMQARIEVVSGHDGYFRMLASRDWGRVTIRATK